VAVLVGMLVFFGASGIAAIMPARAPQPDTNTQPNIVVTNKNMADDDGLHVQLRTATALPKVSEMPAPSPSPAPTPFVFAEVSTAALQEAYQHIEEGVYQTEEVITTQIYRESIYGYSQSEKILIARVVYSEARGEIFEGQVAVASVVLNRFESGLFGRSIAKVVFASDQFAITEKYNASGMAAAEAAIESRDVYPDNLFFFQASKSRTWRNFVYYTRIGGHSFYRAAN